MDYSHTPDSLENALKTVNEFAEKKDLCHCRMRRRQRQNQTSAHGEVACEYSTNPIFTSDNPRSEDPESILDDMTTVCLEDYKRITDRREAIYEAIKHAAEMSSL